MIACYPGTFDPITNGHLDIISRASKMFDEVVVLIMQNPRKTCSFSSDERKELIEKSVTAGNVRVVVGSGLTVRFARQIGADVIIRGIRAVTDYEYELQQATANMMLDEDIETLFLIAKPEFSFLSSSVVKEIAMNGGDISQLVPEAIHHEIAERMSEYRTDVL